MSVHPNMLFGTLMVNFSAKSRGEIYISNLLAVRYFENSALSRFLLYQYETELARLSTGVMETETGTTFKIQHF